MTNCRNKHTEKTRTLDNFGMDPHRVYINTGPDTLKPTGKYAGVKLNKFKYMPNDHLKSLQWKYIPNYYYYDLRC